MGVMYPVLKESGIWPLSTIVLKSEASTGAKMLLAYFTCSAAMPYSSDALLALRL